MNLIMKIIREVVICNIYEATHKEHCTPKER